MSTDLAAKLTDALRDLAEGCLAPSQVAAKLTAAGCAGQPDECCACPVAVWLTRQLALPAGWEVIVDANETTIAGYGRHEFSGLPVARNPGVITEFILQFDRAPEDYPALIKSAT